jgi:hypothetical protein
LFVMSVHAMRVQLCRSAFIIFFSQILFVWLITSVSCCHLDLAVAYFVNFAYQLGYSFFYLGHFVCILFFFVALVTTLFVVSCHLIKDILLTLSSSHSLIPLLAICSSASHHLFNLTRRSRLNSMTTLKN